MPESAVKDESEITVIIPSPKARLELVVDKKYGKIEFELSPDKQNQNIGRGNGNDVQILCDMSVSRKHAILSYANGIWTISDDGGANNTYLNNKKLERGDYQALKDGDIIGLGSRAKLTFRDTIS